MRNLLIAFSLLFLIIIESSNAESFQKNSYIISMGEQPQTYANALGAYGLVYDLVIRDEIPVYWIIKNGKVLFGEDFNTTVYDPNGGVKIRSYSAGSFVIPAVYVNTAALSDITYWQGQGVVVDKAAVDFDAPAYNYITSFPNAILDSANANLVVDMFYQYTHNSAETQGIPSTYYSTGTPNQITSCSDVYALPHADPQNWTTAEINTYKSFITNAKGFLWQGCHSVGAVEAHPNTGVANYLNLNILTTNGQIAWQDDPDYVFTNENTPDFKHETTAGSNPIMQIASKVSDTTPKAAQEDGSQRIYIPRLDSTWRSTTTVAVWDPDNVNLGLNGGNPNKAALIAFGRAYGDSTKGVVVQQASHTDRTGTESQNVSAARFYGNLLLLSSIEKRPDITIGSSAELHYGTTYDMNATAIGGTPPYTFSWSMQCSGTNNPGIFTPATQTDVNISQVTFVPNNVSFGGCILRVNVTDSCNRKNLATKIVGLSGYNPPLGFANITHAGENFSSSGGLDLLNTKDYVNSLYTQVSGQPFDITYVSLDADKETPVAQKGNIILELINPDGVTELDPSSCKNATPYTDLTSQLSLDSTTNSHLNGNSAFKYINNISYPTALKSAAFRASFYDIVSASGTYNGYGIPSDKTATDMQNGFPSCTSSCATINNWGCYKCIAMTYGNSYCSRDNFSIRPAAYTLDLNGTLPYVGGRAYQLDINATDVNDSADIGYTALIDKGTIPTDLNIPTGCSLATSTTYPFSNDLNITNGIATPLTYSYQNVGDVNITIQDTNWTAVDQGKDYNASVSYDDCIADSFSNTVDANGKVGCNVGVIKNIVFTPLTFRNSLTIENNLPTESFTYIANQNDSYGAKLKFAYTAILDDTTPATNDDNPIATNYIAQCFAKDINSTVSLINDKSLTWSSTQNRIWMYDSNTSSYKDTNTTSFLSSSNLFLPGTPGKAEPSILFNFDRNISISENPFNISSNDFNLSIVEYNVANPVSANDFNRTSESNATFVYGRVHAAKQRYEDPATGPVTHNTNIYYEIFCFGSDCNTSVLPSLNHIDDIRWYQNSAHTTSNDGNVSSVNEKGTLNKIASSGLNNSTNKTTVQLKYDGTLGYPYVSTMEINASSWLIHNRDDANATTNPFQVEFNKAATDWVGKHETNATTNTTGAVKTNRRTMW